LPATPTDISSSGPAACTGLQAVAGRGATSLRTCSRKQSAGDAIRVVADQVLTPTYTVDLAEVTRSLILTGAFGLYHLSSEGQCSWYEFTRRIFECAGIAAQLTAVKTADFPSPVKRPSYSVLSKAKLGGLRLSIPSWQDALCRYLQQRAKKNLVSCVVPVPANS
jgi:dTDP-4-dehydrorhamnose reductase